MANTYKQLGQARENSTNAVSVYSPLANTETIIKEIWLCNHTASSVTYYIYHDDDGTTYDESTALVFGVTLDANESRNIPSNICMNDATGNIAYKIGTANAITITLYGVEIT